MLTWALGHALVRVIGTITAHEWVPGGTSKGQTNGMGEVDYGGMDWVSVTGRCQVDKR